MTWARFPADALLISPQPLDAAHAPAVLVSDFEMAFIVLLDG